MKAKTKADYNRQMERREALSKRRTVLYCFSVVYPIRMLPKVVIKTPAAQRSREDAADISRRLAIQSAYRGRQ